MELPDIAIGCVLSLATSLLNHGHGCQSVALQFVDRVVVNAVGSWFCLYGWWGLGRSYFWSMLGIAAVAWALYTYVSIGRQDWTAHVLVHVAANAGILVYTTGAASAGPHYQHAGQTMRAALVPRDETHLLFLVFSVCIVVLAWLAGVARGPASARIRQD